MTRSPRLARFVIALALPAWAPLAALAQFTLVETGGSFRTDSTNFAPSGTAFSSSEIGVSPHSTAGLNDGAYGNSSSWIGNGSSSSAGVFWAEGTTLSSFAFGRDNTRTYADRAAGTYTLYYTTDAGLNSGNALSANWTSLGSLTYPGASAQPSLRNLFNLNSSVTGATGFRIVSPGGTAIDEIELYSTTASAPPVSPGVNNLASATGGSIYRSAGQYLGQAFTTDASALQFQLDRVTLGFGNSSSPAGFTVRLHANSGTNLPGTVLAALDGPAPASPGLLDYTAAGVTLDPQTMYWITWGFSDGSGSFVANTASSISDGPWTLHNRYASSSGGDTLWFESSAGFYMQFGVEATAIPEPSTYAALAGLAALALAAWKRRRTHSA